MTRWEGKKASTAAKADATNRTDATDAGGAGDAGDAETTTDAMNAADAATAANTTTLHAIEREGSQRDKHTVRTCAEPRPVPGYKGAGEGGR